MNAPEQFTLRMFRFIRAPRDKVFDAFTTEPRLASWMGPRRMQVHPAKADAQVGGAWRVEMRSRDGSGHIVGRQFSPLQRPACLAYTWQREAENNPMAGMETLVEIELVERDQGTEMRMTHSGFTAAAARDGHHRGWSSSFNRLSDALDPQGSPGTITLLGDPRSTYTRTARMALTEKAVAYTMQACGPNSAEVLAVHPMGKIPAMRDGEITIWETAAIVNYLDECFDTGLSLRPGSIAERTRALQWVSAINAYLYDTMVRRTCCRSSFPTARAVSRIAPSSTRRWPRCRPNSRYSPGLCGRRLPGWLQPLGRRSLSGPDPGLRERHAGGWRPAGAVSKRGPGTRHHVRA